MAGWGDLLGRGSVVEQIAVWGVLNQIIGDLLGPAEDLIRQKVNAANPELVNSPADLADMVVRGVVDKDAAAAESTKSGIDPERFHRLVLLTGEPIGLEQVLEAYRRGFIGFDDQGPGTVSVERAIKTARYYNEWAPIIKELAQVPISPGEAVNAALRGQIPLEEAKKEAFASGINAERFQTLLNSAGRPPSPTELLELLRRKLIPLAGVGPDKLSFQQGIFEGDSKDKWWPLYAELAKYVPPPRIVTTLLRNGAITTARALELFQDAGLTAEDSAAYIKSVQGEKLAGSRQLAETAVLTLYDQHAIDEATAKDHLTKLGYDPTDIGFLLELTDLNREMRALNSAVQRIGTLYIAHKIKRAYALEALAALDVGQAHAQHLMSVWDIEAAANVRLLTPAQITKSVKLENMSPDEAVAELQALGYTERDAWLLLWSELGTAKQTAPAQGPNQPGAIP